MNIFYPIVSRNNIAHSTQLLLIKYCDDIVGRKLASNLNISEKVQLILTESDDWTKLELATNYNISNAAQLVLANSYNDSVRYYLRINDNVCEEAIKIIIETDRLRSL